MPLDNAAGSGVQAGSKDHPGRAAELLDETRTVLQGRGSAILDSILPSTVYLLLRAAAGDGAGLIGAACAAAGLLVVRFLRRQPVVHALGGLGAGGLAAVFLQLGGSGTGYFLPGLLSGALTVVFCVVSVAANRPLVAWTSHLVRRWPRQWYWHRQVLPAYNEVTIAWGVVYALRLWLEYSLFRQGEAAALGMVQLFLGWPFTVLLLISSYLYGIWRLRDLAGPSVEEFKAGVEPPWQGQRRGF